MALSIDIPEVSIFKNIGKVNFASGALDNIVGGGMRNAVGSCGPFPSNE